MQFYLHVPFCRSKCGYCAFYSIANAPEDWRKRYVEKVLEILHRSDFPEEVESVYIGGGTPTLLQTEDLERILEALHRYLPVKKDAEWSIEANPETLTDAKLDCLRRHVNRISVGIQSFQPEKRRLLGRDCSCEAIENALEGIRSRGFPHFNCDLIYAIPGQSMEDFRQDLERAAAAGADHISCYSLTPEEGTRLAGIGIDEETSAAMWQMAGKVLAEKGFRRYEISNYARPGGECYHNSAVWRGSLLCGIGPAAASYDGTDRTTECADLQQWLNDAPPERDVLPREERLREIFAVNLRTSDGWKKSAFLALPGADETLWRRLTSVPLPESWLRKGDETYALTEEGMLFWDEAAMNFLA
ncbi:MAG: radical SAM family heme chaperone HemW [Lentisphaeria bacterium]|nr:radical SAM family heme chaperone HemW [Lentisphaeria bacterium]